MSLTRQQIAQAAAQGLRRIEPKLADYPVMLGFDGFVDAIISVVDKRHNAEKYDAMKTIDQFGKKIQAAAGMSSNYELVVALEKLGGNGPIMANAMATAGLPVTYVGALGYPTMHPVFEDFAKKAKVITIAEPARTDALEFSDGKLMLGKLESFKQVNWANIVHMLGREKLVEIVGGCKLIGMVNWTMLPYLTDIYRGLSELMASLPTGSSACSGGEGGGGRRQVFIDLTDPEKRTADDLKQAMMIVSDMQKHADVTLGLNLKESTQVAGVLGIDVGSDPEAIIEQTAKAIGQALNLYTVVIHPRKSAAGARQFKGQWTTASFAGPFVAEPKLSTGAGDNFNGGFCLASLAGLPLAQALCVGTATSGYYVRNAGSPTLAQLADFCNELPEPQTAPKN